MCHEREQLIGYVYDEVDARERIVIEAHLSSCYVCRGEVAGLKNVREDLLAWEVPASDPVWRPLPTVQPPPLWRQVPAWVMAAAASGVFALGVAGGMATRFVAPVATPAQTATAPAGPSPVVAATPSATIDAEDMAALEARVLARVRAEMSQQLRPVPARSVPTAPAGVESLARQVRALEQWQYEQVALNEQFDRKLRRLGSVTSTLDARMTTDGDRRMVIPVNFGGAR